MMINPNIERVPMVIQEVPEDSVLLIAISL